MELKAPESEFRSEMTSVRPQPQPHELQGKETLCPKWWGHKLPVSFETFSWEWAAGGDFKDRGDRKRLHWQAEPLDDPESG